MHIFIHFLYIYMHTFHTLTDMPDVRGMRVLVRSELNVPLAKDGSVQDAYRIEQALPTIKRLAARGARVVVCAHIGRDPVDSLELVAEHIRQHYVSRLQFVSDVVGEKAQRAVAGLQEGDVLLLENVRSHEGEATNDAAFARALAAHGELFVSDAFGATHRAHASIVGVAAHLPSYAGLLLEKELRALERGLVPQSPSLFVLGGAKFATKEALLHVALERYDTVLLGGALANDFLKARGNEVGVSLVGEGGAAVAEMAQHPKLLLPVDVVVRNAAGEVRTVLVDAVAPDEAIVDIGPETVALVGHKVREAETIIWNGPMGLYEEGFTSGTQGVAEHVAREEGDSLVGGGDTVAAIRELGLQDQFSFLSTGGGAMLDYLVDGHLPGVEALLRSMSI
jgi:phosphoglycerate kinase